MTVDFLSSVSHVAFISSLQEMNSSTSAIVSDAFIDDPWTNKLTKTLKKKNFVRVSVLIM